MVVIPPPIGESEAQRRYEAAKAHITKTTFGHISHGEGWLDSALRIAAGMGAS